MKHLIFGLLTQLAQIHLDVCMSDHTVERFRKFSTKTTYENSVAQDERYYNISSATHWEMEGCRPVMVVALFRHGIRYPGEKDITNIAKVIFKMKVAGVAASEVDPLEIVANKFLMAEAKDLAATGKQELHDLGDRFGKKLKDILSDGSGPSDYGFLSSSKSRAVNSCENFKDGFIKATGLSFDVGININDHLLRFFDECSKYVVTVAENKSASVETTKFQQIILPKINARIAKQLGVQHLDLDSDELKSLLVVAATEIAVFGSSTWSQLLSDEDLEQLEYAADVKNYWKKGYGFPINYEPSCDLLHHMFQHLENFITCQAKKKAVFYFGHTETVLPIISILGLFRDTKILMADNYEHHTKRQFRTTRLTPFASNIAFVLNDCSSEETDCSFESKSADRFFVRLLFKERSMVWPACGRSDCPYSLLRKHYLNYIDNCNFTEMCWAGDREEL